MDIAGGKAIATRGTTSEADLTLSGPPRAIAASIALGEEYAAEVEIEGDRAVFDALREMVVLPERLRRDAQAEIGTTGAVGTDASAARTA